MDGKKNGKGAIHYSQASSDKNNDKKNDSVLKTKFEGNFDNN